MSFHHRIALVLASASIGLVGCGSDPAPAVDSGTDVGVDVPVAVDVPTVDAGTASVFTATLTGREVVPPAYASTTSGTITVTLSPDRTLISYTMTHTLLLPDTTTLRMGLAGENGDVIVTMVNHGGMTVGTAGVNDAQATAIEQGRAYVSITSTLFPAGELRGQLVVAGEAVYTAQLSPDQENPPNTVNSAGVAEFLVGNGHVRFAVHTTGITAPSASHIHTGAAGLNGAVLIDLSAGGAPLTSDFSGTRSNSSTTDLEAGRWYVNVHSAAFPGGEIRGQILRPGERLYLARMVGSEEVPPVTTTATGTLGVIVNANRDGLTYDGVVAGLTPTMSHLHSGAVGVAGPVVQALTITGMNIQGTAPIALTSTLATDLAAGNIYANVHTAQNPGGEIRGQMLARPLAP